MTTRFELGRQRQRSLGGADDVRSSVYAELDDLAPDLARLATEFAYGDIHSRPGLDAGQRELIIIAVLTALGDTTTQIRSHVGSALGAGVERAAIVETVLQTVPYVGFPRAIQAMLAVKAALPDQPGPPTGSSDLKETHS